MELMVDEADPNKLRLTRDEAVELLSRPLAGVFSSLGEGGWIHSVPVHFLGGGTGSASSRDPGCEDAEHRANGSRTLCVEVTEASTRSYVSVSGPAIVQRPPDTADLRALDERYSRHDFAEVWDAKSFAAAVMIIISIDRWIAWTDWD